MGAGAYPSVIGQEVGYTLDRSPDAGLTQRNRQPFALTFIPMGGILWVKAGVHGKNLQRALHTEKHKESGGIKRRTFLLLGNSAAQLIMVLHEKLRYHLSD